ncbi:MAG: hypothetical protein SCK70_04205 [bacterium]|nr:hypothetical protein [bacterium]
MSKRISWPLLVMMVMIVLFNFFITVTDFGPKVALACDSGLCVYFVGPCYPQGSGYHCIISPYEYGWGCLMCPWNTCN